MSQQPPPDVDWTQIQEMFNRTTRSSGDSSDSTPSNTDSQEQLETSTSSTPIPIPSPIPDADVEMVQQEQGDPSEIAPDRLLSRASGIITDSIIGLDLLHPPIAQHVRQDPNLPPELSLSLPPLGPPGASTSGESGIVIDTVADPRQRGPDNRLRPPQKCLSCQTTQTPEWRRGPYGPRTLCNACGLTYAKLVRDNNNRNKQTSGTKELTFPAALSLSPRQPSNADAGPSYSNRYASTQPGGSGMPYMGASASGGPIDVDLQDDNLGEVLDLDAEIEGGDNLDLEGDEMEEDEGSERGTTPPADRSDLTMTSMGPGHRHGGSHSQRRYHPPHH